MLSKWTNGTYVSTKDPVIYNSAQTRVSIPFFFDPNIDVIISPLFPLDNRSREDKGIVFWEKFVSSIKYSIVTLISKMIELYESDNLVSSNVSTGRWISLIVSFMQWRCRHPIRFHNSSDSRKTALNQIWSLPYANTSHSLMGASH